MFVVTLYVVSSLFLSIPSAFSRGSPHSKVTQTLRAPIGSEERKSAFLGVASKSKQIGLHLSGGHEDTRDLTISQKSSPTSERGHCTLWSDCDEFIGPCAEVDFVRRLVVKNRMLPPAPTRGE